MPLDTSVNPYFDDFDTDNNYKKILFKPSTSLQTRELNQLQSTFTNSLTQSLSANYKNGDIIVPGGFFFNVYDVVTLNSTSPSGNDIETVDADWGNIIGKTITGVTSGTVALVYNKVSKVDSELNISSLYVEYISSGTTAKFIPSETLSISGGNAAFASVSGVTFQGIVAGLNCGVYFLNGYTVTVPDSQIVASQYTANPSVKVGISVLEEIITANDDPTLYDNALGENNFQAAGADRLKISTELKSLDVDDYEDSFVELFRFEGGIVSDNFTENFTQINSIIADNNFNQFGNYITNNIDYEIKETLNNFENTGSYFANTLDSNGTEILSVNPTNSNQINGNDFYTVEFSKIEANINGRSVDTLGKSYINIKKAKDFKEITNQIIDFEYGNYFTIYTNSFDFTLENTSLLGEIATLYSFDFPNTIIAKCNLLGLIDNRLYYTNLIYFSELTFDITGSVLPTDWVENVCLFNQSGDKAIISSIVATTPTLATVTLRTNYITNFRVDDTLSTNVNSTTKTIKSIQKYDLRDARWITADDFRAYLGYELVNLTGNGFIVNQDNDGNLFLESADSIFLEEINTTTPLYINSKYYIVDKTKPITFNKVFIKYIEFDNTIESVQYSPSVVLNYNSTTNILTTSGTDGNDEYTFEYLKSGASFINNFVAYICDNATGAVNGVLPSSAGYAAAIAALQGIATEFNPQPGGKKFGIFTQINTVNADYLNVVRNLSVPAGSFLAFYIFPNSSPSDIVYSIPTANRTCPGGSFNAISGRIDSGDTPPTPVVPENPYSYIYSWEDQICGGDLSYQNFNVLISLSLVNLLKSNIGQNLSTQKIVTTNSNYNPKINIFSNINNTPLKSITNLDLYQTIQTGLSGVTGTTASITLSTDYILDDKIKIWMYCELGQQTFNFSVSGNTINFTNISPTSVTGNIQVFTSVLKDLPTIKDKITKEFKFLKVSNSVDNGGRSIYGTNFRNSEISLSVNDVYNIHAIHSAINSSQTNQSLFDSITLTDSSGVLQGDILQYQNFYAKVLYKDISNPNIVYVKYRNNDIIPQGTSGNINVLNKSTNIVKAFSTTTSGSYYDFTDGYDLIKNDSNDYYQISYLRRKLNTPIPPNFIIVCMDYFEVNDVTNDYISVDSYDNQIELFNLPETYNKVPYTDILDFRYYKTANPDFNLIGTAGNLEDALIETTNIFDNLKFFNGTAYVDINPNLAYFNTPVATFSLDYTYYLNTLSKVFFTYQGRIQQLKSSSANIITEDIENSINLLNINIPPFGRNVNDIIITESFTKLYKQDDISQIERKLNNLIESDSLTRFESQIFGTTFNANNKVLLKSSFLADSFIDTSKINVEESDIAINTETQELLASTFDSSSSLLYNTGSNITITNNQFASLAYTVETQYNTNYASKTITPNIFNLIKWIGHVNILPRVINNYDTFDKIFDYNEDTNVKFIKSQIFNIDIFGVKPNTRLFALLDTVPIDTYIIPKRLPINTGVAFSVGEDVEIYDTRDKKLYATVQSSEATGGLYSSATLYVILDNFRTSLNSNDLSNPPLLTNSFTVRGLVSGVSTIANLSSNSNRIITDTSGFAKLVFLLPKRTFTNDDTSLIFSDTVSLANSTTSCQSDIILKDDYDIYLLEINDAKRFFLYRNITESLAQTFSCSLASGMFLASIDLFFFSKDANLPFGIEIRPIENGVPSERVLLNSVKYLRPSEINVSSDGLLATRFTFDNLIYLKEDFEYCIVFKSKSVNYSLWIGSLDESDVVTNFNIDFAPNIDGIYTTKLNKNWLYDGSTRFKMNLNRAVFNNASVGELELINTETNLQELEINPIIMTANSSIVTIYQKNHGLNISTSITDKVLISGVVSEIQPVTLSTNLTASQVVGSPSSLILSSTIGVHTVINGLPISSSNFGYIKIGDEIIAYSGISGTTLTIPINGRGRNSTTITTHTIGAIVEIYNINGIPLIDINKNLSVNSIIDNNYYTIVADNQATSTISLGGDKVLASYNVRFDKFSPQIQTKIIENTNINYSFSGYTGNSVNDNEDAYVLIEKSFTNKSLNQLENTLLITSNVNNVENLSSANNSLKLNLELSSQLDNISPIVDIINSDISTYSSRLNNFDGLTYEDIFIRDELKVGSFFNSFVVFEDIESNYDSTSIKVLFDGRFDKNSKVGVYARYTDINNQYGLENSPYFLMQPLKNNTSNNFEEFEFFLENLPPFRKFNIKLVFASQKQYANPIIKNFAAIAFI